MRALASVVMIVTFVLVNAAPASSQEGGFTDEGAGGDIDPPPRPDSFGVCDGDGWCVAGVATGGEGSGPGSGVNPCTYFVSEYDTVIDELGSFFWDIPDPFGQPDTGTINPPDNETDEAQLWVLIACPNNIWGAGGLIPLSVVQLGDPPDPVAMRRVAEQAIALPIPTPDFSPRTRQLLGLETWVWLDDTQTAPITGGTCIGPDDYACVTVTAAFVDIAVDPGDGTDIIVCPGAGRVYDFDTEWIDQRDFAHCGYLYTNSPQDGDTYDVVVAGTWRVSYSCRYDPTLDGSYLGGCGGGSLGFIARATDPIPLEILDLQAVATAN